MKKNTLFYRIGGLLLGSVLVSGCGTATGTGNPEDELPVQCRVESAADPVQLSKGFLTPPESARAWVYWFVMDGNLTREGIKADLEAMKRAGIGGAIFLEVNVGVPRGNVDFMSDEWIELFKYASQEAERLGIELTLISGPGWTGSGGPWVKPEDAMHFVVADSVSVSGGQKVTVQLPRPKPRPPYFGEGNFTPEMKQQYDTFYSDLFVLAYPRPQQLAQIPEIDEKALYIRHPYTSRPNTMPSVEMPVQFPTVPADQVLDPKQCIDLTEYVDENGVLQWDAPEGEWIVYRFGRTLTGANTRPAPLPGVGFECSKMDTTAFNHHLEAFVGRLADAVGLKPGERKAGWNMLHIDSWEMGPQNWCDDFREQFEKRRGYDPLPYMAVISGVVVGNRELSERFLWDYRMTAQELVLENHARHLKRVAHRYGMGLSIEPYDMSPNNDIALGSIADVPMCEFWEKDDVFNSAFSCIEATSAAHINNRPIVGAEAFTSGIGTTPNDNKSWRMNPGNMKDQADWAYCIGINRFVFHRYAHQPWLDRFPGMTMGPYGVHYERTQTWWELSGAWHTYLARCQYMLRQGIPVADILYLTPEEAPFAFAAPTTALDGTQRMPFKRGYGFDGCDPETLIEKASVRDGKIVFPGGVEYSVLVLPNTRAMTLRLLEKVESLIESGAVVLGYAPVKSLGLTDYPACDERIAAKADKLWGELKNTSGEKTIGKGRLFAPAAEDSVGLEPSDRGYIPPYVRYGVAANVLKQLGVRPDFESSVPLRYIHRKSGGMDIYMISNPTGDSIAPSCTFRVSGKQVTLWDAVQGKIAPAVADQSDEVTTTLNLDLEPHGSLFVIFADVPMDSICNTETLHPDLEPAVEVKGPWKVAFQEHRGAPDSARFDRLIDWSQHSDPGIRYFSGIADYDTSFELPAAESAQTKWYIDLGDVSVMARVVVNGETVTELWKAPYRCDITPYVKAGENRLQISVANEWPNRMAGDLLVDESERVTFSTYNNLKAGDKLKADFEFLPSGLMGPVRILRSK